MSSRNYTEFEALTPFFQVVMEGLQGKVAGEHFFDTIADGAVFEFRYQFPGWPEITHSRSELMEEFAGYGNNIRLHAGDSLVVHRCVEENVIILEYQVHGTILRTGKAYDNRFISVITIEAQKIVRWVDYMDSLAAWMALTGE